MTPVPLSLLRGTFNNVAAQGSTAYLTSAAGLSVVTATSPVAPAIAGTLPGSGMVDVAVSGSRAYVAETSALAVVNVSNPATPFRVASLSGSSVRGVAVERNLLYFSDGARLRIHDADTFAAVGEAGGLPGTPGAVAVSGGLAFVALGAAGVAVVDVSTPSAPVLAKVVPTAVPVDDIASRGRAAFFPGSTAVGRGVLTIDAADPAAARIAGETTLRMNARGVAVSGDLLFAAENLFSGSLPIFNVSRPESPVFLGTLDFPGENQGLRVAAARPLVYRLNGSGPDAGLAIGLFDQEDPPAPPSASLISPLSGSSAVEGSAVAVRASAADNIAVARVTYFVDGVAQSIAVTPPDYPAVVRLPLGSVGRQVRLGAQAQDVSGLLSAVSEVLVNSVPDPLTTVSGRLVTVFGAPIPNAPISVADKLSATSGPDGTFIVSKVPTFQGNVTLASTAAVSGLTLTARTFRPPVLGGVTRFGDVVLDGNVSLSGALSGTLDPRLGPFRVTSDIEVQGGQTLTLGPGTILKFAAGRRLLVVGTLNAVGAATAPVAFTSLLDDELGGDTGRDGPTAGAPGNWSQVLVIGGRVDLARGVARFGGSAGALLADVPFGSPADITLSSTTLSRSAGAGVRLSVANSSLLMRNSQAVDNAGPGLDIAATLTLLDSESSRNGAGGIRLAAARPAVVRRSTVSANGTHGFDGGGFQGMLTLEGSVIAGNPGSALSMNIGAEYQGGGNAAFGNAVNGIEVGPNSIEKALTWRNIGLPYVVRGGNVSQGGSLAWTFEAGVTVKLLDGGLVKNFGLLQALGTEAAPVVFTSLKDDSVMGDTNNDGAASAPAPGDWRAVLGGHATLSLTRLTARYGGATGALVADGAFSNPAGVTLSSCTLTRSAAAGVKLSRPESSLLMTNSRAVDNLGHGLDIASAVTLLDSESSRNAGGGIRLAAAQAAVVRRSTVSGNGTHGFDGGGFQGTLTLEGNVIAGNPGSALLMNIGAEYQGGGNAAAGNAVNGIEVVSSGLQRALTWRNIGLPYVVRGADTGVSGAFTWTVGPGVVVKLQNAGLGKAGGGVFEVLGLSTAPVVFTSLKDDSVMGDTNNDGGASLPAPGDWRAAAGGDATLSLTRLMARYGGATGGIISDGLFGRPADIMLSSTTLSRSAGAGVRLSVGSSSLLMRNSQSVDNAGHGLDVAAALTLSDSESSRNGAGGIRLAAARPAVVRRSTLSANGTHGFDGGGFQGPLTLEGNAISGNAGSALFMNIGAEYQGGGNAAAGNAVNGIEVGPNSIEKTTTWRNIGLPYVVRNGEVGVGGGSTWTFEAGTTVKLLNANLGKSPGLLQALGTEAAPVVFTSFKDDSVMGDTNNDGAASSPAPGDWKAVRGGNATFSLTRLTARYGGAAGGMISDGVFSNPVAMTLSSCTVSRSATDGILTTAGPSSVDVRRSAITGNAAFGARNAAGGPFVARENWWGSATGPTHSSNPGGTGDKVSGAVDFTPFLTEPPF